MSASSFQNTNSQASDFECQKRTVTDKTREPPSSSAIDPDAPHLSLEHPPARRRLSPHLVSDGTSPSQVLSRFTGVDHRGSRAFLANRIVQRQAHPRMKIPNVLTEGAGQRNSAITPRPDPLGPAAGQRLSAPPSHLLAVVVASVAAAAPRSLNRKLMRRKSIRRGLCGSSESGEPSAENVTL